MGVVVPGFGHFCHWFQYLNNRYIWTETTFQGVYSAPHIQQTGSQLATSQHWKARKVISSKSPTMGCILALGGRDTQVLEEVPPVEGEGHDMVVVVVATEH